MYRRQEASYAGKYERLNVLADRLAVLVHSPVQRRNLLSRPPSENRFTFQIDDDLPQYLSYLKSQIQQELDNFSPDGRYDEWYGAQFDENGVSIFDKQVETEFENGISVRKEHFVGLAKGLVLGISQEGGVCNFTQYVNDFGEDQVLHQIKERDEILSKVGAFFASREKIANLVTNCYPSLVDGNNVLSFDIGEVEGLLGLSEQRSELSPREFLWALEFGSRRGETFNYKSRSLDVRRGHDSAMLYSVRMGEAGTVEIELSALLVEKKHEWSKSVDEAIRELRHIGSYANDDYKEAVKRLNRAGVPKVFIHEYAGTQLESARRDVGRLVVLRNASR